MRVLREDQETEWWRARETDDFNLKKKLLRVGCRPLKRKLLACQKSVEMDLDTFAKCKVRLYFLILQKIRVELDDCYKSLHFLQM